MRSLVLVLAVLLAALTGGRAGAAEPPDVVALWPTVSVLEPARCASRDPVAVASLPDRCFIRSEELRDDARTTWFRPDERWLRLRMPSAIAIEGPWFLRLSYMVHDGDLTVVTAAGRIVQQTRIGMAVPIHRRAVPTYDDRVPIAGAVQPGDVLVLHLITVRARFETLELRNTASLAELDRRTIDRFDDRIVFLLGMLAAMAVFYLLWFGLLGGITYLYYGLAMLAMIFFQVVQSGAAWELLWPDLGLRDDGVASYFSYVVYFAFVTLFARSFLDLPRTGLWGDRIVLGAFALLVVDAILYVFTPGLVGALGWWNVVDPLVVALVSAAFVGTGAVAWLRGVDGARWYTVAVAGAAVGYFVADSIDYGLLAIAGPGDVWSALGVVWEAMLFAVALALRMRTVRRHAAQLSEFAYLDPLTTIANRRAFDDALRREWRRGTRTGRPLSLVLLDIDRFKAFNDAFGHQAGDETLCRIASEIGGAARRSGDFAARFGGEEFALILPETPADGALAAAENVRGEIVALAIAHDQGIVTVSAGVATIVPDEGTEIDALVAAADRALYEAKRTGRNRSVAAPPDRSLTPPLTSRTFRA